MITLYIRENKVVRVVGAEDDITVKYLSAYQHAEEVVREEIIEVEKKKKKKE